MTTEHTAAAVRSDRRSFLIRLWMASGLGGLSLVLLGIATRYLYPLAPIRRRRSIYLAPAADVPPGEGRLYGLPTGESALVTATGQDFVALSNICPHLGCKVDYDASKGRFVCPCHNGVFDKNGIAISGPPAEEGKNLKRFAVSRVGDNLFVEIEETVEL